MAANTTRSKSPTRPGIGDSSDDFYVAYFDSTTGQLRLATYVVTYPALRKGQPIEALE